MVVPKWGLGCGGPVFGLQLVGGWGMVLKELEGASPYLIHINTSMLFLSKTQGGGLPYLRQVY